MKYIILCIVLFILLLSIVGMLVVTDTIIFKPKAQASLLIASEESSFVFTSPAIASIQAKSKVRATILCISTTGVGLPNLNVTLQGHELLVIDPVQSVTDSRGRAIFDISALDRVKTELPVVCGNTKIDPTVHVNFQ